MEKCSKCESAISDNDVMAWKCMECGKAFKVNLSKLKKLQVLKNKPENTGKMLLKCSACGNGIDNGDEKIACKCSTCGNVMIGKLRDFAGVDESINLENTYPNYIQKSHNTQKTNREEIERVYNNLKRSEQNKKKKTIFIIGLVLIVFALIIVIFVSKNNTNKTKKELLQLADNSFYADFEEYKKELENYPIEIAASYELKENKFEDGVLYLICDLNYTSKDLDVYSDVSYGSQEAEELCFMLKDISSKGDNFYNYSSESGKVNIEMSYNDNDFIISDNNNVEYKYSKTSSFDELIIAGETKFMNFGENTQTSSHSSSSSSYTGTYDAKLEYEGTEGVLICVSEDAMDRFMTAVNNQNDGSLYELLLNGEVAYTKQGTKCNIVNRKFTRCQVKLLEGAYAGSTVWVVIEALQEE